MPKNKNSNLPKSPFRDFRNPTEQTQATVSNQMEDRRSKDEKVSDLTDLFIGDHHIDPDIIHAVLEECGWNVENATEKLFEVFFTNSKPPAQSKKKESNGLANIAVSILMDKSSDFERDFDLPPQHVNFDLASVAGDVNNNSSAVNQRQSNNLKPKISSHDNLARYGDSSKNFDSKPAKESKMVFETKTSQRDFYNKNSFGDMAVNMEHYGENIDSVTKTSNFTAMKDALAVENSSNDQRSPTGSRKTRPKFDLSKVSADAAPSMNKIENSSFEEKKNTSVFYTDKSMESLFSGGHSPSTSVEWDNFYKQLDLQPVHSEKVYPEISVNELLASPKANDSINVVLSPVNKIKPSFEKDIPNQSGESHTNLAKSDNRLRVQIPKAGFKDRCDNSSSSDQDALESKLVIVKDLNTDELEEKPSSTKAALSIDAPEFVPRVLDDKRPMTRKSPAKELKSPTKSSSANDHRSRSSEKSHMFKKGKDSDKKKPAVDRNAEPRFVGSGPRVQFIDPMDPLGWNEIKSMASSKSHKSDFKRSTKLLPHGLKLNVESSTVQSNDKTAVVPPFSFNATTITPPSNKNKKYVGKKKDKFPKSDTANNSTTQSETSVRDEKVGLSSRGCQESRPSIQDLSHSSTFPDYSFPSSTSSTSSMPSLPPSLSMRPHHFDPLPQRDNSKRNIVNHMVPKGAPVTGGNSVVNKVQFVGVKTPVGKLKHYIDKKQPVMFILRGLPGSGKSYLAAQLVSECQRFNLQAAALSSDSYFTSSGEYNFNFDQLSEAHIWNRQRAQECLKNRQPVVIIDNTNTTMWEMKPYAEMAILNGYDIQVCEPDTQWRTKVQELARRNQHGVSRDHIKRMKDRYENVGTDDVLRAATKSLKGKNKLPRDCKITVEQPIKSIAAPASKVKPQAVVSPSAGNDFGSLSMSNPQPVPSSKMAGKDAPSSLGQGLTQWVPAMEQRDATRKSKKPGLIKKPSSSHEITLDFLNNSIKKALVGIERTQEADSEDIEPDEIEKAESESLKDIHDSVITQEGRKDAKLPEIKIEHHLVNSDGEKDGKETESNKEEESSISVSEPVDATSEYSLDVSHSLQSSFKLENSGSAGELYYSCGSEDGEDVKEQVVDVVGGGEEEKDQDLSDNESKNEEKSLVTVSQSPDKILSFESCLGNVNSPAKEAVPMEKDYNTPVETPICLGHSDDDNLHVQNRGRSHDKQQVATSAVTIPEVEDTAATQSSHSEKNENSEKSLEDKTAADTAIPQKQSLVLYSDSEDEDDGGDGSEEVFNHVVDSKAKPPYTSTTSHIEKIESLTVSNGQSAFVDEQGVVAKETELRDQVGQDQGSNVLSEAGLDITVSVSTKDDRNQSHNVADDTNDDKSLRAGLPSEPMEDDLEAIAHQSEADTPESNSPTREQSPVANEGLDLDNSYIKKKKKRRVKPVKNTPFLEDALKAKSKTENWNKFFFSDSQSVERQTSPAQTCSPVITDSASCQCEPYYFSMVYRLNSEAFSHQQPIDTSNIDVVVVQATSGLSLEDRFCSDVIVQRKSETTDRSTLTDETVDSEEVDLETLQDCFPEYSRKQLEEVMAVCQNDLEWVTNNLMDTPPMGEVDEEREEDEVNRGPEEKREDDETAENTTTIRVPSLAQLCRKVVQDDQVLDSDDFEQQVINASQTRLQEIENFAWVRMHSTTSSVDASQALVTVRGPDVWPDNFSLDSFSAGYGLDDDFGSDPMNYFQPPHHQPKSPKPSLTVSEASPLPDAGDADKNKKQLLFPTSHPSAQSAMLTVPVLPMEFIRCLETNYGSLNTNLEESGLALDDSTARKIYNCLKLLMSKKRVQIGPDREKQMREDEAMARALQEAEDASRRESSLHSSSVPGWTNDTPSWMQTSVFPQSPPVSVTERKHNARANPARMNSVSDALHSLRGAWPKRLKPFKFRSQLHIHRQQDLSVWTNKSSSRPGVADMHSIMEEEKAREATMRRILVTNKSAGRDVDDLATKIKRIKLSQMFPFLPVDVLEEIFMNNGYGLERTVKCLQSEYDHEPVLVSAEQEEAEVNRIMGQSGKGNEAYQQYTYQYEDVENVTYEDLRNEAQFYDKLANECRQKAHRHHGEGMHHVSFFYRQEVKKYLAEKDDANQRAARLLFDKGSERLLRENTLDLHSYHIDEAIEAVNLALEMKKEEYKSCQSDRKRGSGYLTVITGRGKNSKWGVPRLKPAISSHLNNKNYRFEETAPGMFKVQLFPE